MFRNENNRCYRIFLFSVVGSVLGRNSDVKGVGCEILIYQPNYVWTSGDFDGSYNGDACSEEVT